MAERFCVDCRHYEAIADSDICNRPLRNLVTGASYDAMLDAYDQRSHDGPGYCGAEGLFWEASDAHKAVLTDRARQQLAQGPGNIQAAKDWLGGLK